MPTSTITLGLLKIPVSDIEKAAAFYESVLGFEKQFVAPEYGWAQLQAGELPMALYKPGMGGGDGKIGGSLDFHLVASSADDLVARLKEANALVDDRIHQGDDGSRFLEATDPDGNKLKIMLAGDSAP